MVTPAYAALWVFIFSVPWDRIIVLPGMSIISRSAGALAMASALLAVVVTGKVRRWHLLHVAALLFVAWAGFDLLVVKVTGLPAKYWTYVQLLAMMWIVWELAPTQRRQFGLLTAYIFGAYVAAFATLLFGKSQGLNMRLYSAGGADPNDLAMTLAIGIPMAWYLAMVSRRFLMVWIYRAYLPVAVVVIGLTGSRGGMVATMVALLVIPLTMTKLSTGRLVGAIFVLILSCSLAVAYVPDVVIQRFASTGSEVEDLRFGGRFKLWVAGYHAFTQSPIMGYGTAGFIGAITPELGSASQVAHDAFLSVLVEEGVPGFVLYLTMILAAFLAVESLPRLQRRFARILFATLLVAMLPLTWEDHKVVWFVLAALVGMSRATDVSFETTPSARPRADTVRLRAVRPRTQAPAQPTPWPSGMPRRDV